MDVVGKKSEARGALRECIDLIRPYAEKLPSSPHAKLLSNLQMSLKQASDDS